MPLPPLPLDDQLLSDDEWRMSPNWMFDPSIRHASTSINMMTQFSMKAISQFIDYFMQYSNYIII